jgi:hypothetical protein
MENWGKNSSFSASYETGAHLSMAENRPNVPKHRHGISLREVSALVDMLKELSIHEELEIEVVFFPLKPLVEFDLQTEGKRMHQTPN